MKRNRFILCLMCFFALISASNNAMGQYANVTSSWIDKNGKSSNGEKALVIHYSLNVVGCYGHTITASVDLQNEEGVFLFNKNHNKLTASNNHEIHYDDSNVNDRTLVIPYSKFNIPSGRNTYYYQIIVNDKVTGAFLGSSDFSDFELTGSSGSSNSNSSNSSKTQKTSSSRSASFSDLRFIGGKNNKGEDAFLFYYDVNLKGCNNRKVKVQLSFKDSSGNYLYGKDNKKLIWSQSYDVKSDNIKFTDKSFALTFKQLNTPSAGKNYYYQFAKKKKKTGDLLGQSQRIEQYIGNAVVFKDQRLNLNDVEDWVSAVTYSFHLDFILPEAHDLKLVCALETDKHGRRHHFADGREMIKEHYWKNDKKWVSGYLNVCMGFDYDEINPLPGKHTYYMHIYVYDGNTGKYITESSALSFDAEDESKR